MSKDSLGEVATQRLNEMLEQMSRQGLRPAQIAARVGVPPQYLSDAKQGHRPMTELFARRLGEELAVNYEWLVGKERATKESPDIPSDASQTGASRWLPVLNSPMSESRRQQAGWDGSSVEVSGAAAAKMGLATKPYVLRFCQQDVAGRLRAGDLLLISQDVNESAEISVVRHRKKCFLVRPNRDGSWCRVSTGDRLPNTVPPAGHVLGIVWSAMT